MSNPVRLDSLKYGESFTICNHDGEWVSIDYVLVRGDYDRSTRKYECFFFDHFGPSRQYNGSTPVYVNFFGFRD